MTKKNYCINPGTLDDVVVVSGANDGRFRLGGKRVKAIRDYFVDALSIPGAAAAYINGHQVEETAILDPGDVLEFIVPNGVKGALDPKETEQFNRMAHQINQLFGNPTRLHRIRLSAKESDVFEVLGDMSMDGKTLARKAGYTYATAFRETLAALVRHGLLINDAKGYRVPSDVKGMLVSGQCRGVTNEADDQ